MGNNSKSTGEDGVKMLKIMKILLKIEKWFLDKCIEKDTLEYEDYLYSIKKHEKEIERISRESMM